MDFYVNELDIIAQILMNRCLFVKAAVERTLKTLLSAFSFFGSIFWRTKKQVLLLFNFFFCSFGQEKFCWKFEQDGPDLEKKTFIMKNSETPAIENKNGCLYVEATINTDLPATTARKCGKGGFYIFLSKWLISLLRKIILKPFMNTSNYIKFQTNIFWSITNHFRKIPP